MSKIFPTTLSFYLMRHYGFNFLMLLGGILAIVYLFDTVELLKRAAKVDDVSFILVLQMGLFKLPEVGQLVFPFAILFSAMLTFWQLTRRHELTIVRSAGLSVWQFITPLIAMSLLIGIINITIINPIGTLLIGKYENMEDTHLKQRSSQVSLSEQGLWLRQDYGEGMVILHSANIKMPEWTMQNVMAFFFKENNNFERRIDAKSAKLTDGEWNFEEVVVNRPKMPPEKADFITLATNLTLNELEDSFSDPELVSFWKLRGFIQVLDRTGFDSTPLRIHFQNLLSQPLLFMAMVLLAATVSLRPPRFRGASVLIMAGVLMGFGVFFASSFLQALGASQQIPIIVASWFPAIISFLAGLGILMSQEDG